MGSEAERARFPRQNQSIEKSVHQTIRKREKNQHHIKTQLHNNKGDTLAKYTDLAITWSTRQDFYSNHFFCIGDQEMKGTLSNNNFGSLKGNPELKYVLTV